MALVHLKHTIMYNPHKIIEDNTVNNVCAQGLSGALHWCSYCYGNRLWFLACNLANQ